MNASDIIDALQLRPHPEGGWYAETWRRDELPRAGVSAIYPTNAWRRAVPVDGWVLVGRTVSPAFEFSGFRLAEPGWFPDAP